MWVGPAQARGPEPRAPTSLKEQAVTEGGVRAADFPYIGDSLDQDIHPALAVGIPAVWLRTEHRRRR